MEKLSIALFYGHAASNIGDLAINSGFVNLLKQVGRQIRLNVVFLNSEKNAFLNDAITSFGNDGDISFSHLKTHGDKAHAYLFDPAGFLRDAGAETADVIVLNAGEHLFDYTEGDNSKNLFWRVLPAYAAKALGKTCVVLPSTFGPFETLQSVDLFSSFLNAADAIASRDLHSQTLLQSQFGFIKPPLLLDPGFFAMNRDSAAMLATHENRSNVTAFIMRSENWGIRLPKAQRIAREQDYATLKAFAFTLGLCQKLLATPGAKIKFFVQTTADKDLAEHLNAKLAGDEAFHDRIQISRPISVQDYIDQLGGVDRVIASRFHALVLGLLADKPVHGVYFKVHAHKIPGLFDLLEASEQCVCLTEESTDSAIGKVLRNISNETQYHSQIKTMLTKMQDATLDWLDRALSGVKGAEAQHQFPLSLGRGLNAYAENLSNAVRRSERARLKNVEKDPARKKNIEEELIRLKESHAQIKEKIQKKERNYRRNVISTQKAMLDIKHSTSYCLGHLMLRTAKSPLTAVRLPSELWRLYRDPGGFKSRKSTGYQLSLFNKLIQIIEKSFKKDAVKCAEELQFYGGLLYKQGYPEAELVFAKRALLHDRSVNRLRAVFWAAQRADRIQEACDTILDIEEILGDTPSEYERKRLLQMKRFPVYQLSLLKMIKDKRCEKELNAIRGRICYVLHNSLPYSSGGYAARSHGVASGLKTNGFDVIALTRPGFPLDVNNNISADSVGSVETFDNIEYHRILDPVRSGKPHGIYMHECISRFEDKFIEIRPSVVWAASSYLSAIPALIAARNLGIPFVYEIRGLWELTRMSQEPEYEGTCNYNIQVKMESATASHADYIFTLTKEMREEFVRRGIKRQKITLLPNSCDTSRFYRQEKNKELADNLGIPPDVPVIGYVGTFRDYEGFEDLTEACIKLKEKGLEFRLLLVGNENFSGYDTGPIMEKIMRLVQEHNMADWLIMPGRVPHKDVEKYYSLIDISPFPRKPWPVCEMVSPMKPLEALAMEKAVVVSSVRALAGMIKHKKTGLIFQKGSVESLTHALDQLVRQPEFVKELGRSGRKWVQRERTWIKTTKIAKKAIYDISPSS